MIYAYRKFLENQGYKFQFRLHCLISVLVTFYNKIFILIHVQIEINMASIEITLASLFHYYCWTHRIRGVSIR